MSMGFRADPTNTSGVITVAGADQVVVTNASNVVATTFTGALAGNADTATKLATATGTAPSFGVRAWVNVDGTRNESGVVDTANTNRFIRGSGNVASFLRNTAGIYTLTFTTPMLNANYAVIGSSSLEGAGDGVCIFATNLTATDVNILSGQPGRAGINTRIFFDSSSIFVLVIG